MSYELGQRVRLTQTVRDLSGVLTDTTMAITVTSPSGVITHPTIVHDSVGVYHADVDVNEPADWLNIWTATGIVVAAWSGQFNVRAAGLRIVSLAEAKDHLNKDQAVTADDDELRGFVDAAQMVVEGVVGPTVIRSATLEYYDGGTQFIILRNRPAFAVVSINEYVSGQAHALIPESGAGTDYDYILQPGSILRRRANHMPAYFPYGCDNIEVTYSYGRNPIPANIRLGALETLSHLWRNSQLARGDARAAASPEQIIGTVFTVAMPTGVIELLAPNKRAPQGA